MADWMGGEEPRSSGWPIGCKGGFGPFLFGVEIGIGSEGRVEISRDEGIRGKEGKRVQEKEGTRG